MSFNCCAILILQFQLFQLRNRYFISQWSPAIPQGMLSGVHALPLIGANMSATFVITPIANFTDWFSVGQPAGARHFLHKWAINSSCYSHPIATCRLINTYGNDLWVSVRIFVIIAVARSIIAIDCINELGLIKDGRHVHISDLVTSKKGHDTQQRIKVQLYDVCNFQLAGMPSYWRPLPCPVVAQVMQFDHSSMRCRILQNKSIRI